MTAQKPTVVVLGYYEDLTRNLRGLEDNFRLLLFITSEADCGPGKTLYSDVHILSDPTADSLAGRLAEVGAGNVAAVVPGRERYTTTAAQLGRRLGVEPGDVESYRIVEDKYLLRIAAQANGLCSTFFMLGTSVADVLDAQQVMRDRPLIIKPRRGNASRGVTLLPAQADVATIARAIDDVPDPNEFLIEEFVEGRGYSVEIVRSQGRTTFHNVTSKSLSGGGGDSPFIPVQHTVPAPSADGMLATLVAKQAHFLDSIGAQTGLFHGEWQMPSDGRSPYLIECAARFPGGALADAVQLSYGVNLAHSWVHALVGDGASAQRPAPATGYTAAVSFLAPESGMLRGFLGISEVATRPETHKIIHRKEPGTQVRRGLDGSDRLLTVLVHSAERDSIMPLSEAIRRQVSVCIDSV